MASIKLNWSWIYWNYGCDWSNDILPQILESGISEQDLSRSVYVLRLNRTFAIEYPKGVSSVLYIGEGNFKSRLDSHSKKWLGELWELIENYGLTIGITTPRVRNNVSAYKDVEAALLSDFAFLYGTAPLNNKQYEYAKIEHNFDIKDLRTALKIGKGIKHKWSIKPMKSNKFYGHYHKTHL